MELKAKHTSLARRTDDGSAGKNSNKSPEQQMLQQYLQMVGYSVVAVQLALQKVVRGVTTWHHQSTCVGSKRTTPVAQLLVSTPCFDSSLSELQGIWRHGQAVEQGCQGPQEALQAQGLQHPES